MPRQEPQWMCGLVSYNNVAGKSVYSVVTRSSARKAVRFEADSRVGEMAILMGASYVVQAAGR